ncbi:Type VI secretion system-associated [Candidatus Magnetomorum sp. HK-1]|nr:Type VI secretion system-associated [Candidatus Magnetomorum sp. HK-1]
MDKKNTRYIQSFGKLPFYADYISHVFDDEAAQWKKYLMERFQSQLSIDAGLHPFIYNSQNSNLKIVGTIEPSHDGIREFPFSLFVAKPVIKNQDELKNCIHIWHVLMTIRWQLTKINDIESCYAYLETCSIDISREELLPDDLSIKLNAFLIDAEKQILTIGNDIDFTFGE